jgi:hypothetical protein
MIFLTNKEKEMFKLNFKTFMIIATVLAIFVSTLLVSYVAYTVKTGGATTATALWTSHGTYVYAVVGSNVLALVAGVVALFIV